MAFVYNNKLPFYSWGVLDVRTSPTTDDLNAGRNSGIGYQLNDAWGHLVVPLPETGEQKLWNSRSDISGSPTLANRIAAASSNACDVQIPWKLFCGQLGTNLTQNARRTQPLYGLTLHGELYRIDAQLSNWSATDEVNARSGRRIARICSKDITAPVSFISNSDSTITDGSSRAWLLPAVTKDGKAWRIGETLQAVQGVSSNGLLVDGVSLPAGETAKKFWFFNNPANTTAANAVAIYVVSTDSGKTYVRKSTGTTWYCLTGGCVRTATLTISSQLWTFPNLPKFTVSAPPAGGTTATVEIEWRFVRGDEYRPEGVRITNPGSGYTTNPTVTTTAIPTSNANAAPPYIELQVFNSVVEDALPRWAVPDADANSVSNAAAIDSTGKLWGVKIPALASTSQQRFLVDPPAFTDNTTGNPGDWAYDITPKTTASPSSDILIAQYVSPQLATGAVVPRYIISKSGELYVDNALFDSGPWACVAQNYRVACGVKRDGTMWSWGSTGTTISGHCFGDETELNITRSSPTQIASAAEWVSVFPASGGFVAIRKDAICRGIDQPMEYWPDWYFQQQTA